MPYISVKTSVNVTEEKKTVIETRLTDAITIIPGKRTSFFMCSVEDNVSLMFHYDKEPTAIVQVNLLGSSTKEAYGNLTAEICKILQEEIGVSGEYCFVQYCETQNWGYNGYMF